MSKGIKYLGINLTKEVKDFYTESTKALKEKKKKITQINGACGRINIAKMSILSPKVVYRVNAISIKVSIKFFLRERKHTL